jgi:hypothetical protein
VTPEESYLKKVFAIFEIFSDPMIDTSDWGVHVNEVVQQVNGGFTEPQVREAVWYLINQGYLHATVDGDHFRSLLS